MDLVDVIISNVSHFHVSVIMKRPYSSIRVAHLCILPLLFTMVLLKQKKVSILFLLVAQVLSSSSYASFWILMTAGLLTFPPVTGSREMILVFIQTCFELNFYYFLWLKLIDK